jgi:hypothetical protein
MKYIPFFIKIKSGDGFAAQRKKSRPVPIVLDHGEDPIRPGKPKPPPGTSAGPEPPFRSGDSFRRSAIFQCKKRVIE